MINCPAQLVVYKSQMATGDSIPGPSKSPTAPPHIRRHDWETSKDDGSNGTQLGGKTASPQPKKTPTGLYSEHGHSLSYIRPMTQHPGSSVSTFFNGLFTTSIGISTLGTSVTFSYVLSNNPSMPRSSNSVFNESQIQDFLAISWLLFLLALANASFGSTLLTFFKDHWVDDWNGVNGRKSQFQVQLYAVFAAGFIGALVMGAFVLLCLVVVAYSAIVGWIALGFTSFFALVIAISVLHHSPWPWRSNTPSPDWKKRQSRETDDGKGKMLTCCESGR